jgi:hypothetical protein
MRPLAIVLAATGIMVAPHAGNAQVIDDPFNDYLQRSVTISMGAGNAKDTNAAIHTIHPWPPYVGNTHIHTTGRQGADAVQRMYRTPDAFSRESTGGAAGAASGINGESGAAPGSTSPTGAPVTPMQPLSGNY